MTHRHNDPQRLDLVIIGGGPAGMSAALTAGRAALDVLIVNAETNTSNEALSSSARTNSKSATTFAEALSVTSPNDWGMNTLDVTDTGGSDIDRLYVIGDTRTGFSGLIAAAAEGVACAEAIVHEIASERWSRR